MGGAYLRRSIKAECAGDSGMRNIWRAKEENKDVIQIVKRGAMR